MSSAARQVIRAIIYIRVSTNRQEDLGTSLESQEKEAREYCQLHGYNILKIMPEVHTGADLDERPVMTELRRRFRKRDFDVLVIWKFDRLSREQTHQAVIIYEAQKYDIRIESVHEKFDDTPLGRFMRSVIGFHAEIEREDIKLRTATGMRRRVERGEPWGGPVNYGYSFNESRTIYYINPETAPIVQRIFTDLALGKSAYALMVEFHNEGIPSPLGKEFWPRQTFYRIVSNPIYWGKPEAYRTRWTKERRVDRNGIMKSVLVSKPGESIPVPNRQVPALIDEEIAMKAQVALKASGFRRPQKTYENEMLLFGGLVRCGNCGRSMRIRPQGGGKWHFYHCGQDSYRPGTSCYLTMSTKKLDSAVWSEVLQILQDPKVLRARIEDSRRLNKAEDLDTLRSQIRDTEDEHQRVTKAIVRIDDDEAAAPLIAQAKALASLSRDLHKRLGIAAESAIHREEREKSLQRVLDWSQQVAEHEDLNVADKRLVLKVFGIVVLVFPQDVSPRYQVKWGAEPSEKNYPDENSVVTLEQVYVPTGGFVG